MIDKEQDAARRRIQQKLYAYLDTKREHEQIREELEKTVGDMTAPKSPNLDGMPRGGSGDRDPMVDRVSAMMKVRQCYERKLSELAAAQLAVEEIIDSLDTVERRLLRYRYISGLTWREVCNAMSYSRRQMHTLHTRALDKLVEREKEATP